MNRLLTNYVDKRRKNFHKWIDRRIPSKIKHTLSRRNLFIFPSRSGFTFLLITAVLWILGTNYQNNLVLALVFFMIALLVVAILATFSNMSNIQIEFLECKEAFVGDTFQCRFLARVNRRSWADGIEFRWQGYEDDNVILSLDPNGNAKEVLVPFYAERRGPIKLPRLGVQSVFPFGLVRCWTWLNIGVEAVVFPRPINGRIGSASIEDEQGEGIHPVKGSEDFSGLREYVPGDNLRHIAWKAYARGQGLFVKDFSQSLSKQNWLDLEAVGSASLEEKLSILCFWVLHHYQQNESYGLSLPGQKIGPDSGYEHRNACLSALAYYKANRQERANLP